ncbi:MAG: IGHMBP2 family helicase [Candidatus Magasanikbacteria bacterium]
MQKIQINGLQQEGPGDIVGAITSKVGVSPNVIGNIDMDSESAEVEIYEEVADDIVEKMDGNTIGKSKVEIIKEDEAGNFISEITGTEDYISTFKNLVDLEREEEMKQHREEMENLSGNQREEKGRAILHLRGQDQGDGLGGYLVKFMRNYEGEELPDTEISVGDLVMLSKQDPLRDDNPTGTVIEKTKYSITVSFSEKPQGFVFSKDLRMDLYVNDITFQRMKDALDEVKQADGDLKRLKNILVGESKPKQVGSVNVDYFYNQELNESQQQAVKNALSAKDFHLIHGPPGTGKTTTVIEVIQQCVDKGQEVLATADSNTAVDNILEFLIDQGVQVVRVGHPARVTPKLREHTLDSKIEDNSNYQKSKKLREEAFELKDKQDELTYPSGKYRRGMSDEQIKDLADKGKGSRGVSPEKIQEMAKSLELEEKIDEKFDESRKLEDKAVDQIIKNADVVCSTNSTAGTELIKDQSFDVVIIDEATQATEPSCLIPITHGHKVVMAGDHKQLPPTIKSQEAAEKGLDRTMFERLAYRYGDQIKDILTTQYRMHENIMNFSAKQFYEDKLKADESVKNHTLEDLNFDASEISGQIGQILDPEKPAVFVNLTGSDIQEETKKDSPSKFNKKEADVALQLVEGLEVGNINPEDIGIITPYKAQADLISSQIGQDKLEVDTVDGFQGREKEVIIISLVRSNPDQQIGFLDDVRRLNVAITRAKRKLVVIGDETTLQSNPIYAEFMEYISQEGFHFTLVP